MAKPASVNGEEIDLAGNKIQNLSLLKNVDRSKCRVLNLHNNMLSDLTDLPRFLFLTELNISSNRFTFIPDLSFLPALTILDVSGNTIESVVSLSFLPGLKSLKLAYNCLTSLHGINGANVPNLEYLDIRGNKITASEHEIKPIGSLLHLKEVSVTTTNLTSNRTSNRTSDLQIIALLFKTCSSLKFIDRKSQAIWREVALREKQSAKAAATAAAGMAAAQAASNNNNQHSSRGTALDEPVSTPLFDQVAAKFKHGLSSSPGSAEKGNSSSSASRSSTAAGTRTTATPRQGRGPPVYQHQQQQQAISPDVSFVDGKIFF